MTNINQQQTTAATGKPKGRLTLIAIFVIAFVPMALATYMYFNQVLVPSGRTNNGAMMLPPLAFDELDLSSMSDERLSIDDTQKKWVMITLADGVCEQTCVDALYKTRQVNVALHKESDRVIRYLVMASVEGIPELDKRVKKEYPLLHLAKAEKYHLKAYLDQKLDANEALAKSYILIVDPIGNIMMYYTPANSGKDILEDLKRLLKVSQIG